VEVLNRFTGAESSMDTRFVRVVSEVASELVEGARIAPEMTSGFTDSRIYRLRGIPAYGFVPCLLQPEDLAGVHGGRIAIAYEPIWAIGTGTPDSPKSAAEMIHYIRERVSRGLRDKLRILYGGSLSAKNADAFLKELEIGGALVGGASLNPRDFIKIINSAKHYG